ncbi:DUF222 domain-containing protein [Kribbella jiaozuonensis]|uniref:DUF222 domain-containing protein n=1 Tax=Kribbella jiaozuonensis TaxID=2575441 RepID=A0A4U3M1I2_9ACTN|nr:DUF222 domain-containing protein [Kribbella jiaozuonensis]TKK82170.1 DUF222 domain-containing protein [Kribbella jiaozuonensis]
MFDTDLSELATADLLESAVEHRLAANRADARLLEHAQIYADRFHPSTCGVRPGRRSCDGRERAVVLGGEGCPEIAEFAVAEFGVVLGISPMVAARFIGEALALRHRFPFTWARVLAGDATPWKARQLASACVKLSEEAATYVDQRIAPLIDSITPYRLEKIIRAAKRHADPELARAEAAEAADERGVFVGRSDDHGNKTLFAKAPAAAVIRHDATIAAIADALQTFGDTRHLQHRRADAIGIIADPRYTQELLTQARNHPAPARPTDATVPGEVAVSSPTTDRRGTATRPPTPQHDTPNTNEANPTDDCGPAHRLLRVDEASGRGAAHGAVGDSLNGTAGASASDGTSDGSDHSETSPSGDPLEPPDDPFLHSSEPPEPDLPADPFDSRAMSYVPGPRTQPDPGLPMDLAAQRALDARLAEIKQAAYTNPTTSAGQVRPGHTEIFVHLTDHTLATGNGVLRAEGIGPLLADQLTELVGHEPYVVKPVIDLNDSVSADAYEIPTRIREHVRLTYPVELFPYGTRETHRAIDLDHIQPYDPYGPAGQTSTRNLAPLSRYAHRVKTHAPGWNVRRVDTKTLEWTTPHGFTFRVNPTGTHRVDPVKRAL